MNITVEKMVGELVAEDYRTAEVFANYGIDFCCKGNRSIGDVCETSNIETDKLLDMLNEVVKKQDAQSIDYKTWPMDLLADYIEKKHHRYVEEKIPVIRQYLAKICQVHGNHHPELFEVEKHFNDSAGELAKHMKKEELILFPFIRKMVKAQMSGEQLEQPNFGTVENPVEMMKHEHETEGERFARISEITNRYTPPADACNTYMVTFALLKEFEEDLHLHIHLENNILFPRAIELEKELRK